MQMLEGDIQKADLQPRTNAEVLLKSSVREDTVLNELKFGRKSQGQEKINFFFILFGARKHEFGHCLGDAGILCCR